MVIAKLMVKGQGQVQRSRPNNKVKVKGRGQRSRSRSRVKSKGLGQKSSARLYEFNVKVQNYESYVVYISNIIR